MGFKIEGNIRGQWTDDAAGGSVEDNTFGTREEAEEQIPILAKYFDCQPEELRVVES